MQVHVKRLDATLVALVFACSCVPPRRAVAYSPVGYQRQKQEPHRDRLQNVTPRTALVAPSAFESVVSNAQRPQKPGDAGRHHVSTPGVGHVLLHEEASIASPAGVSPDAVQAAEAATTGATVAGAAAAAGAAVGSAAAAAGAAAANGVGAGFGVDPSMDAGENLEDLVFHLLAIGSDHTEEHAASESSRNATKHTPLLPGKHGHTEDHMGPQSTHTTRQHTRALPSSKDLIVGGHPVPGPSPNVTANTASPPSGEDVHTEGKRVPQSNYELTGNTSSRPPGEHAHAEDHKAPGTKGDANESAAFFPSAEGVHPSPSAVEHTKNVRLTLSQDRSVASWDKRAASNNSFPTRAAKHGFAEVATSSPHRSHMGEAPPTEGSTTSVSSAVGRDLRVGFISSTALEPFVSDEDSGEDEVSGRSRTADLTVSPSQESEEKPDVADSPSPSTTAVAFSRRQKPKGSAWLCRISEPYKGCNKRLYYPGMEDRTSEGDTSAGRGYIDTTCPFGFCCSKITCSWYGEGCGSFCSGGRLQCLWKYEDKSNGKGCSCDDQPAPRCHQNAVCHESLRPGGGVWCECKPGYKGNGLVCCEIGTSGPGCDDMVRRPGVQATIRSTGSTFSVSRMTLWLFVPVWGFSGYV